jgi:hypothetical protein
MTHPVLDFSGFDEQEHPSIAIMRAVYPFKGEWTADLVHDLISRGGRNSAPDVLRFVEDRVSDDVLREVILWAWSWCDFSERALGSQTWLRMFKRTGYVTDSEIPRPHIPMTVWRGARTDRTPHGMAWSFDRSSAEFFVTRGMAQVMSADNLDAFRRGERVPLGLFEVTVPPHAVLAIITEREEHEVVVNPRCLRGRNTPKLVSMTAPPASLPLFVPITPS